MNLFRSEEHVKRWSLYYRGADDYVMSVADWASVFTGSMFRNRLDPDYLAHSADYLEDYSRRLSAMGKKLPAPDRVLTTVMFTDIVSSTERAALVGDTGWRSILEVHNEIVRARLEHHGGAEVKQTGDGFLATFESPTRAIQCAVDAVETLAASGIIVRVGIHSGECEVLPGDLGGIGVHIAARVLAAAQPGEVLVSRTVKDAVTGSDLDFDHRGMHPLKGVPGHWELYAVTRTSASPVSTG